MEAGNGIWTVAFSPDGKTLVSGGLDSAIRLWDVAKRAPIGQPLLGHRDNVYSVAFSPDGRAVASGSGDGSVMLWDTDVAQWPKRACAIAGGDIDQEEWPKNIQDLLKGESPARLLAAETAIGEPNPGARPCATGKSLFASDRSSAARHRCRGRDGGRYVGQQSRPGTGHQRVGRCANVGTVLRLHNGCRPEQPRLHVDLQPRDADQRRQPRPRHQCGWVPAERGRLKLPSRTAGPRLRLAGGPIATGCSPVGRTRRSPSARRAAPVMEPC